MSISYTKFSSFGRYNIFLASVFGLDVSVYLTYILDNQSDNQFILDRNVVLKNTFLSLDQQKDIEKRLVAIQLISIDKDVITINFDILNSIFEEKDKETLIDLSKLTKKKNTKQDAMKRNLKSYIHTTNPELRDAYTLWIDAVFDRQGWMSERAVTSGQDIIDNYSSRNLDVALDILKIAAINGYRDLQWAVNTYEKEKPTYATYTTTSPKEIKLAKDIF